MNRRHIVVHAYENYEKRNDCDPFFCSVVVGDDCPRPEQSATCDIGAACSAGCAEAGADERRAVCSAAHLAGRRGDAALSARLAFPENGARARGRAIQHEQGRAWAHQQHRQHPQSFHRSASGGARPQHRRGGHSRGRRRAQHAQRGYRERGFCSLLFQLRCQHRDPAQSSASRWLRSKNRRGERRSPGHPPAARPCEGVEH